MFDVTVDFVAFLALVVFVSFGLDFKVVELSKCIFEVFEGVHAVDTRGMRLNQCIFVANRLLLKDETVLTVKFVTIWAFEGLRTDKVAHYAFYLMVEDCCKAV